MRPLRALGRLGLRSNSSKPLNNLWLFSIFSLVRWLGGGAASKYTSRNCAGHASHTGELSMLYQEYATAGNAEGQTRQCWQLLTARMAQQKNESTRKREKLSLALLCFKFLLGQLSFVPRKQATLFALLWLQLQSHSLLPSSQGKRVMANDASALFICHAPHTTHTDTDTQTERQTWRLPWLTRAWVGLNIVSCLCVWHVCRSVLVCVCVLALSGFKLGRG